MWKNSFIKHHFAVFMHKYKSNVSHLLDYKFGTESRLGLGNKNVPNATQINTSEKITKVLCYSSFV
jgi:hypothetical protein